MLALSKKKKYTPEEYLALEREAKEKSEFHDGKIVPRASSDIDHVSIMVNFACELHTQIKQRKAKVMMCDMKVRTPDSHYFLYPDILVLLEKSVFHDEETDVILNPSIIVEIVSEETEAFDKGSKFFVYQEFQSLKEYVLVDQRIPRVEKFVRESKRVWNYSSILGLENSVRFETVEAKIYLNEIYQNIETEAFLTN